MVVDAPTRLIGQYASVVQVPSGGQRTGVVNGTARFRGEDMAVRQCATGAGDVDESAALYGDITRGGFRAAYGIGVGDGAVSISGQGGDTRAERQT